MLSIDSSSVVVNDKAIFDIYSYTIQNRVYNETVNDVNSIVRRNIMFVLYLNYTTIVYDLANA